MNRRFVALCVECLSTTLFLGSAAYASPIPTGGADMSISYPTDAEVDERLSEATASR